MITKMWTQRRTTWIAIGAGAVILTLGSWFITGWERRQLPPHEKARSDQNQTKQEERGPQEMSPSEVIGPAQAYAMVTPTKQQLIGVTTAVLELRPLETTVRAVGRIEYNEERIAHVNLRISGWVEDLFIDYTGQLVRKGQPLFTLYSQDLVATQDEFLLALKARNKVKDSPVPEVHKHTEELIEASRDRLHLWGLTDQQIEEIARRGKANTYLTIYSPVTGYVIEKKVFKGMYVQPETRLYSIADLSLVWMNAEVYEFELPFVKVGQRTAITFTGYPGEQFHGRVSYIYPYLNEEARTIKVRVEIPNPELRLKPEMYGTAQIKVNRGTRLAVPESAVLDSGARQLVFLVRGGGLFEPRTVQLGPKIGGYYEVQEGLDAGDKVVTSGNFLIDSESKLMAATDMMGSLGMGGIQMEQAKMGQMDMGGMPMGRTQPEKTKEMKAPGEKKADGLTFALSTEPASPRIGENLIRITVRDEAGKPIANAKVQLTYTMPMPGMMPATVPMKAGKDGAYEAKANLGMGGQWDLTVTVQPTGQSEVKETFSVIAGGGRGMSGMQGM
ncbi:MAG: putative Co/Zn/Cd efflux system membrane fusion protein [Nitrospira sp.]|jgi:Cu(I)/Ag(I) efflux system membrane fusion protein|nr:putative Co/Zn/Cd efflux system membrane fusion protein [Nitrospira sp.]